MLETPNTKSTILIYYKNIVTIFLDITMDNQ